MHNREKQFQHKHFSLKSQCQYFKYSLIFQIYIFGIAGERMTERIRSLMFRHMLRQEIGFFDRKENGVGALCTKLSNDASSIQGVSK